MKVLNPRERSSTAVDTTEAYTFGPFQVDARFRQLRCDGEIVALSSKAFDTLLILLKHRDRIVDKDELMKSVWPDTFVSEDSLTHAISVLRRILKDNSPQPQFILTVPRRGYQFIAPVTEIVVNGLHEPSSSDGSVGTEVNAETPPVAPNDATPAPVGWALWLRPRVWIVGAALVGLAVIVRPVFVNPLAPPAGPIRFTVDMPEGTVLSSGGLVSPDGRHLAFVAQDLSGRRHLWVRTLNSAETRALPGTDGAHRPFWSPDSQTLGFFANGKLKKVGLTGAPLQTIAHTKTNTPGGSWSANGFILFSERTSGLFSVPVSGEPIAPATALDQAAMESGHRWPQFLPDGRHFLYFAISADPEQSGTYVGAIDSPARVRLLDASSSGVIYAPPDFLLYVRDRVLMAQRFDVKRLRLSGEPVVVTGDATLPASDVTNGAVVSASDAGVLAFVNGGARRLVWFDRSGQALGPVQTPTILHNPTLSPNGKQLIGASVEPNRRGLWLVDLERGGSARIVAEASMPLWSPDGARVAFTSSRANGALDLYVRSLAGQDHGDLLLPAPEVTMIQDWSPDGRYVVYSRWNSSSQLDLWVLPISTDGKPAPLLTSTANETQARVSPDGRWIAYASDESGQWEVYVQSFPTPGAKGAISIGGGGQPQWRQDGRELFYLSADSKLMAVDVSPGNTWQAGRPNALFGTHLHGDLTLHRNHYVVSADGQRFLIDSIDTASPDRITVLANWTAAINP